jgi:2-polyprenyl-3-methyl-5-hydroxy-6-metoxy-1,4-benzoquinol methylase
MRFAEDEFWRSERRRVLDLGCGAGRNAIPLARLGWDVVGIDTSIPMLRAATQRARDGHVADGATWPSRGWTRFRFATGAVMS